MHSKVEEEMKSQARSQEIEKLSFTPSSIEHARTMGGITAGVALVEAAKEEEGIRSSMPFSQASEDNIGVATDVEVVVTKVEGGKQDRHEDAFEADAFDGDAFDEPHKPDTNLHIQDEASESEPFAEVEVEEQHE